MPENAALGKLLKEGKEHGDYVYEYADVKSALTAKTYHYGYGRQITLVCNHARRKQRR